MYRPQSLIFLVKVVSPAFLPPAHATAMPGLPEPTGLTPAFQVLVTVNSQLKTLLEEKL